MATASSRALRKIESANEDIADSVSAQLKQLRRDLDSITEAIGDYSSRHLAKDASRLGHQAVDIVRHQGAVTAKQISHQADVAGRAVRENPIPVIAVLGALALASALIFTRDEHHLW